MQIAYASECSIQKKMHAREVAFPKRGQIMLQCGAQITKGRPVAMESVVELECSSPKNAVVTHRPAPM